MFMEKKAGDQVEKALQKEEKTNAGFFRRWVLRVLIPLLLLVVLAMIIASFAGVNVGQKMKDALAHIPVISSFSGQDSEMSTEEYNKRIVELEAQIQEKNTRLEQFQKRLEEKETEIDKLALEKKRLEETLDEQLKMKNENTREMKEMKAVYETMSPKRAASIIAEMKQDDALRLLSSLSPESLAKILEKMPPDRAAKLSENLTATMNEGR
jgi:flagellar motility protein MotE (MotC chaperone)